MGMLEKVVLVKVDAEKGDGPALKEEHRVHGYPTFILAGAEGQVYERWMGYTKDDFLGTMGGALADLTTIDEKKERFAAQPNAADAARLGRYHDSVGEIEKSLAYYERAAELDPGSDYAYAIFDVTFAGARGKDPIFSYDDVRQAADAVLVSETATADDVMQVAHAMVWVAGRAGDRQLMLPYLEAAMGRSEGSTDERLQRGRRSLMPLHALYIDGDEERAVELKKETMPEGWLEDASQLNSFAWWCFENGVNLQEARALAELGVELAEAGSQRAMILDTLAEICNSLEDCESAVEYSEQAIAEDPTSEFYKEQLARFKELC